jgi:hypothetical protein
LQTTFLGWWSCAACGKSLNSKGYSHYLGGKDGVLCNSCHRKADKRLKAIPGLWARPGRCSWCRRFRRRVAFIGKKRICWHCYDEKFVFKLDEFLGIR